MSGMVLVIVRIEILKVKGRGGELPVIARVWEGET
jgi:hypothetical protein